MKVIRILPAPSDALFMKVDEKSKTIKIIDPLGISTIDLLGFKAEERLFLQLTSQLCSLTDLSDSQNVAAITLKNEVLVIDYTTGLVQS